MSDDDAVTPQARPQPRGRVTYLLVDGENIDATLGNIYNRKPSPDERPRWERVRDFALDEWGGIVRPLFFLNASGGLLPMSFVQALMAMDYRPIPLSGGPGEKVVDMGIQRVLEALVDRQADVLLASHDGDFVPQISALLTPGRRVGVLGLREYLSHHIADLAESGLEVFDLEHRVHCFTSPLPRVRIIPIDEFDPQDFL